MVKHDGELFWAQLSATEEQNEGGLATLRLVVTDITERKRAEEALARSEQKFRALFDSTNDAVLLLDQKGFFDCNQATLQIMGCSSREEFCTKHPADLSPPQQPGGLDSRPLAEARIAAAMATGSQRFEWVHRRVDTGASFPAEVLLNPFQLEGRTVVQAVVHDITERKQAEVALTASVSLLNATLESTADGILAVDLVGRIKCWNQKFAEMWRIPAVILASGEDKLAIEHVLGQLAHSEEFLAKVKELYQHPEATSHDQIDLADGRVFYRYSQPQRIGAAVVGRVWSFSDITESKQAAERLQQSEQKFRLLLQHTAQGIYGIDRQGNCTFANPACCQMLGYEQEEDLLGRHTHTLMHHTRPDGTPYPASDCRLHQALTDPAGTHVADECFWRRDGSSFPVEYWAHPILHDGQIIGVVAAFFDIAERLQAEAKVRELLAQTQRDAHTKAELLKEVNHRVKNNLLAILGLALVEQLSLALVEQRHAAAEDKPVAQRITANLRRRIEGLLEVHQMVSALQWAPVPVSQLAETIIRAALAAAPANCSVTVAVSPSPVKVSPRQASNLALVFNELATNTVKYALAHRPAARVTLAATATASLIRLEYRDDGPGYPPAVLRQEQLSVGMTLVRDLTTQTLRGQLTLANDTGAVTVLEIKTEEIDRT